MATDNKRLTLEENLATFNEELVSNVNRLASFIRSYEGGKWGAAQTKASLLLREKKAIEYIESVRKAVAEGIETKSSESPENRVKPVDVLALKRERTIYEKNFDRLMAIAPGLDEKLINYKSGDEIYGKSVSRGYMDLNFELLFKDKGGFHFAMSHYYKENGDMIADPDMEILINMEHRTIEALHFQDRFHYEEVYDDKISRKRVDKKEQESQNSFLGEWLKNLKKQDHKIEWEGDEPEDVPTSFIEDKYQKSKIKKAESKKDESTKPDKKEEEIKEEAKIISLPKENLDRTREGFRKFISIVAFQEMGTYGKNPDVIGDRVEHILEHQGASDYLVNAWGDLLKASHPRLKELNFYRLTSFVPDLFDLLNDSGEKLRLVSEKTSEVFSMELGDNRKKDAKVVAIYQLQNSDNIPTLLLKVNEPKNLLSVDLSINSFANMSTFNADDDSNSKIEPYLASVELENWLKFLKQNKYSVMVMNLKAEKGGSENELLVTESEPIIEFQPTELESPESEEEPDNNYINANIPDFEPGQVKLTETHLKHGVTQEMIDYINKNKTNVVVIPRKTAMVYNTKDKKADLAKQAQMPGFRLSKTGKFYYEGRSNRSDRTRDGY